MILRSLASRPIPRQRFALFAKINVKSPDTLRQFDVDCQNLPEPKNLIINPIVSFTQMLYKEKHLTYTASVALRDNSQGGVKVPTGGNRIA